MPSGTCLGRSAAPSKVTAVTMEDAPRRRPVRGRTTWLDRVRRTLALLAVLVAVGIVASGRGRVCSESVTGAGAVVTTCRAPQATDGVVIGYALLVLLLLGPDLAEAGVPGLFTLRRRVDEHESRLDTEEDRRELLESQLVSLSARLTQVSTAHAVGVDALNIFVSGDETAGYAAADRPVTVPPTGPPPTGPPPTGPPSTGLAPAGPAPGPAVVVDRVSRARYTAADLFIRRMRAHPGGVLEGSSLHLYLPDETGLMLVPVFEADRAGGGADWWQVGQGIVGRAWRDGEVLAARGQEILDSIGDLPLQRREQHAGLAVVVAAPALNAVGRAIAVLGASATDPTSRLDAPEGIEALVTHAEAIARILVDLLGWESDE
jgi:hypothetical protein